MIKEAQILRIIECAKNCSADDILITFNNSTEKSAPIDDIKIVEGMIKFNDEDDITWYIPFESILYLNFEELITTDDKD